MHKIVISDLTLIELRRYSLGEIESMLKPFESIIERMNISNEQLDEARKIASERGLPKNDVLHAIIARDNDLILVTRDNHFRKLKDISAYYKPEQLI